MAEPFVHQMRVRYAECDAQGVVFNAHYLALVDHTMTELFRAAFGSYGRLWDDGLDMVLAEARMHFREPARFDETLDLEATVSHLGTTSMTSAHRIWREDRLLAEVELRHVWVDRATTVKTPLPDWARHGLAPWYEPESAPR